MIIMHFDGSPAMRLEHAASGAGEPAVNRCRADRWLGPVAARWRPFADRTGWPRIVALCLGLLLLAGLNSACAPRQRVVFPPDWQPRAQAPAQPKQQPAPPATAAARPASTIMEQDLTASAPAQEQKPATEPPEPPKSPQLVASLHLVDEGNRNLVQGQVDEAIALFEQAIQIDGYNGEAFFGLAKAWQQRDAPGRALEFARKAEILFQDRPSKLKKVYLLQAEILESQDDWHNASSYRAKADRL